MQPNRMKMRTRVFQKKFQKESKHLVFSYVLYYLVNVKLLGALLNKWTTPAFLALAA